MMTSSEVGRFIQAIVAATLGVIFIALTGVFTSTEATWAMLIGAGAFFVVFGVTIYGTAVAHYDSHIDTAERYASTMIKADPETREALGWLFPKMRYVTRRGIVRGEFEDTGVDIDTFRLFLQTSNDKYISPKRDWQTATMREKDWLAIYLWLEERGYIVPESASGSVSWLWVGNSYKRLCAYWMAGRNPVQLDAPKVYAQEVDMPELTTPPQEEDA